VAIHGSHNRYAGEHRRPGKFCNE
jgi:hypothetical protein